MCLKHISNIVKSILILLLLFLLISIAFAYNDSQPQINSETEENTTSQKNDAESLDGINFATDVFIPLILQTLGAFLGFISALALSNCENRTQSKELESSLQDELRSIQDELEERIKPENHYLMFRYLTPAWDSGLTSGILSASSSRTVYKKYVKIYSKIKYAQELEKEYTQSNIVGSLHIVFTSNSSNDFIKQYVPLTDVERKKWACAIYDDIKKLLSEEDVC